MTNLTRITPKNAKILAWLKGLSDDDARVQVGASYGYLRLIAYGHRRPSAKIATAIEKATCGDITRKELRPDDWQDIWPEIAVDE